MKAEEEEEVRAEDVANGTPEMRGHQAEDRQFQAMQQDRISHQHLQKNGKLTW